MLTKKAFSILTAWKMILDVLVISYHILMVFNSIRNNVSVLKLVMLALEKVTPTFPGMELRTPLCPNKSEK